MYIAPNSIIRVLKNCPLDNTYDHTIYFDDINTQATYFKTLTKYTLTNQTYQRVNRAKMRVQVLADDLYDCNYIMFQNTSFGNKWFYAFIRNVDYVNNITSEIEYEIDVMQTWAFDYQLGQSFVEREHSVTDVAGDNLVPENLELGEYISEDFDASGVIGGTSIVVAATFDKNYNNISGSYYAGIFSGLWFTTFENTPAGASECANFIEKAGAKSDGIISVFLMPTAMVTESNAAAVSKTLEKAKFLNLKRADGGDVKNKKLLTYPYNFMYVTTLQGNHAEYPYEYFSGETCEFNIAGDMSPNPSVILSPINYKGVMVNYDEKLVLSGFPQLSFNTDTFKQWLGQNALSLPVNALSSSLGAAKSVGMAQIGAQYAANAGAAAAAGLATSIAPIAAGVAVAGVVSEVYQHAVMPHQAKGGGGSTSMAAMGLLDFAFMHKHIRPEFISIIDDYFTMYGYATHRVKIPNRAVRPHWTYTKTIGCVIHGSVPCDDMSKICSIFNNGITFWKNGDEIGNYSLDNSV